LRVKEKKGGEEEKDKRLKTFAKRRSAACANNSLELFIISDHLDDAHNSQ